MYVSKDALNHFLVYFSPKNSLRSAKTWYYPYSAFLWTSQRGVIVSQPTLLVGNKEHLTALKHV